MRPIATSLLFAVTTLVVIAPATAKPLTPGQRVRRATVLVVREVPGSNAGSQGTGFFINRTGLVVTNNHVVDAMHGKSAEERAEMSRSGVTKPNYFVLVAPGTEHQERMPAELLYQRESVDLAILQLKGTDDTLPKTPDFIELIPDHTMVEGMKVQVTGFPAASARGTEVTITRGEITELMRTTTGAVSYVETDAEVHPGNSGGPVTNQAGKLVGIATHKRFRQGEKDRSGAVPTHLLKQFLRVAFEKGVISERADIFPFSDIFLDQNGVVRLPIFPREDDGETVVIHASDGNVRKATLQDESIQAKTALGDYELPLDRAAYLFVDADQAIILFDGGDQLVFSSNAGQLTFDLPVAKNPCGCKRSTCLRCRPVQSSSRYSMAPGWSFTPIKTSSGLALSRDRCTSPAPRTSSPTSSRSAPAVSAPR